MNDRINTGAPALLQGRPCKAPGCAKEITDKTRSKFCEDHRGPSTHAKPTVRFFAREGCA